MKGVAKSMRIVNRKKFIRSIAILIFLLVGLFNISVAKSNKEAEIIDYTITPGQTLWSIAREYTPNSKDIRDTRLFSAPPHPKDSITNRIFFLVLLYLASIIAIFTTSAYRMFPLQP